MLLILILGDPKQETYHRYKWIGFSAVFVFYVTLFKGRITCGFNCFLNLLKEFGADEKKLFKMIWEMHKKIPLIHCYADVTWNPCQFFRKNVPIMIKLIGNPGIFSQ